MAGLALVITGMIVLLTSFVVIAGEEIVGTGFIIQVLIEPQYRRGGSSAGLASKDHSGEGDTQAV